MSGVITGSAGTTSYDGTDTFNATSATYGSTDLLLGGAGNDVLNIAATAAVGPANVVVGIETINVTTSGIFTGAAFDASGVVGVGTTLNVSNTQAGGNGAFAVTNAATGLTVNGASNVTALSVATAASAAVTVNTAVAGATTVTGTTPTLTFTGTGASGLTANSATTVTATSTSTLALTVGAATTVTASSTGASTLVNADAITTLNLSGNGAANTMTVTAGEAQLLNRVNISGSQRYPSGGTRSSIIPK